MQRGGPAGSSGHVPQPGQGGGPHGAGGAAGQQGCRHQLPPADDRGAVAAAAAAGRSGQQTFQQKRARCIREAMTSQLSPTETTAAFHMYTQFSQRTLTLRLIHQLLLRGPFPLSSISLAECV